MKIISTNLSKVKTVSYAGKEVRTGIFKIPTVDEVIIEKLNIVGDEQGDLKFHGGEHKAVYALSANHYEYWKHTLKNNNLSYGMFGENFTISDLDEENINIGDQLRVGTALLEVSQPRVPCFKLGIALDNKDILKLFTQHYRTGVYFRVLEGGIAQTGDLVHIEKKAAHGISIKKLFQAYFDKHYDGYEIILAEALALEKLAPEWTMKLKKKLSIED